MAVHGTNRLCASANELAAISLAATGALAKSSQYPEDLISMGAKRLARRLTAACLPWVNFNASYPHRSLNDPTPSTAKYPAMKTFQLDRAENSAGLPEVNLTNY
jgi:hypothetical protein